MNNNKFKTRLLLTGACFIFLLSSCKKSFVNGLTPTNSSTTAQVFASTDAVRAYFNGIYRTMRSQWQNNDASAGGSTDTWGYSSIFLARDVKGTDIVMPNDSWYFFDYQNANREPTYRRTKFVWYFFYELVNQVNNLIAGTQASTTITDSDKTLLIAEARALRAYFFFELAREFSESFTRDSTAPGIPIYTVPTTYPDSSSGSPRGTLIQTFAQINSDIQYACQNIGSGQLLLDQVNSNVAWGMAARIYLEEGHWADAEAAAVNAMANHALDAANYPNNYDNASSPELLWQFPQTVSNGGQSLYYGTPSSFFVQDGSGYDAFCMSAQLVQSFSLTDVRNTFYVNDPNGDITQADAYGTNKFGTATGSAYQVPLLNGNVVALKTVDFNETLNFMRMGEMYLIEAEAKARQNENDADDVLFALQSNRDPAAVKSGNTGQALIDEILLERRKELYGEMGIDFSDYKRCQLPIDRSNSNHAVPFNYVIPANDPRFSLKIPLSELQSNKAMTSNDQNP